MIIFVHTYIHVRMYCTIIYTCTCTCTNVHVCIYIIWVYVVLVNTHTYVRTTSEVHNTTPTVLHGETAVVLIVSHYVELCHDKNLVGTVRQFFFERYCTCSTCTCACTGTFSGTKYIYIYKDVHVHVYTAHA